MDHFLATWSGLAFGLWGAVLSTFLAVLKFREFRRAQRQVRPNIFLKRHVTGRFCFVLEIINIGSQHCYVDGFGYWTPDTAPKWSRKRNLGGTLRRFAGSPAEPVRLEPQQKHTYELNRREAEAIKTEPGIVVHLADYEQFPVNKLAIEKIRQEMESLDLQRNYGPN